MQYCPSCGKKLYHISSEANVATEHTKYGCAKCDAKWEETILVSTGEVLHISPVKEV